MTNLMLYEICVRQRSIPLPVDAERQPVGALRGAGLRPTTQYPCIDKQKGTRVVPGCLTGLFQSSILILLTSPRYV